MSRGGRSSVSGREVGGIGLRAAAPAPSLSATTFQKRLTSSCQTKEWMPPGARCQRRDMNASAGISISREAVELSRLAKTHFFIVFLVLLFHLFLRRHLFLFPSSLSPRCFDLRVFVSQTDISGPTLSPLHQLVALWVLWILADDLKGLSCPSGAVDGLEVCG